MPQQLLSWVQGLEQQSQHLHVNINGCLHECLRMTVTQLKAGKLQTQTLIQL